MQNTALSVSPLPRLAAGHAALLWQHSAAPAVSAATGTKDTVGGAEEAEFALAVNRSMCPRQTSYTCCFHSWKQNSANHDKYKFSL